MVRYWGAFVKHANPTTAGLAAWPSYGSGKYMSLFATGTSSASPLSPARHSSGTAPTPASEPGYSVLVSALCSIWANSRAPPVAAPTAPAARKPREERQDSTDHRDCAENNDPVLSHDPVEISDREDPIDATDRALPIEPTDKAEPMDPTDRTDPTEPIDNTES